jgi:hypothetical protein
MKEYSNTTLEDLAKMTKTQLQKMVIELINQNISLKKNQIIPIKQKAIVSDEYVKKIEDIIEQYNLKEVTRKQDVAFKRHAVRWFLKKNTNLKHREIALLTSSIEQSTINHSVSVHERLIETKDSVYIDCVSEIMNQLNELTK